MTRHQTLFVPWPPPMRGKGALLLVLDYEHGPGRPERVVVRGMFTEGEGLPEELAADPPEGVTRNTVILEPGRVVYGPAFRIQSRDRATTTTPGPPVTYGGPDAADDDDDDA